MDGSHTGTTYTWSFPVGEGPRKFSVTATDTSGNSATTPDVSITLDDGSGGGGGGMSTAPTVTVDSPTDGDTINPGDTVNLQVTATDDGQVVEAWVHWQSPVGDVIYPLEPVDATHWALDLQVDDAAPSGDRVLTVSAWDDDGNRTDAPDVTLHVP